MPYLAQAIPGGIELSVVQSQRVSRRIEHFRPSSVKHEALKIASLVSVVGQKCVDILSEVLPDQGGNLGGKYDAEALLGDVPAHHVFRVGIEHRARGKNLGPRNLRARRYKFRSRYNDRRSAIGKESRRDQVCDRKILSL